jgi:hypothetical protein
VLLITVQTNKKKIQNTASRFHQDERGQTMLLNCHSPIEVVVLGILRLLLLLPANHKSLGFPLYIFAYSI